MKRLRLLEKIGDVENPDRVKAIICTSNVSEARKQLLADAYDYYCQFKGYKWTKPHFTREAVPIFLPLESELDALIAKRKKKQKEDSLIVPMKTVPIILDDRIEPWGRDIANWLIHTELSKGQLNFKFGSTTATKIVKANLRGMDKHFHLHLLRHYRISHLITNYGFNPYELTSFTGWSIGSTFGALGIKASSNIDVYSHLSWKSYIDKLALPLNEVL